MGTDLLALGIVVLVVGSFLFYKMKVMVAAHASAQEAAVSAAKARAMALLFVGALLTAASIPANLLASSAPWEGGVLTSASDTATASTPTPSSSEPSPAASSAVPSAQPSVPPAVPRAPPAKNTAGRPVPARKK